MKKEKSDYKIQQEIAEILGTPVEMPLEKENYFGGEFSKPLALRKAKRKDSKSTKAIVKLMVMMTKMQEFRDKMNTLMSERIEGIRSKIETLLVSAGISPVDNPEDRILYGDATIKFIERSVRVLEDGRVSLREKEKEERFQMKADMVFIKELNESPAIKWAQENNKKELIETEEYKKINLLELEQMIRDGKVPNEVALAASVLANFASNNGILEQEKTTSLDVPMFEAMVKNGEVPSSVIKASYQGGNYRTTIRKPLKIANRCSVCGEMAKEKSHTCSRCGVKG